MAFKRKPVLEHKDEEIVDVVDSNETELEIDGDDGTVDSEDSETLEEKQDTKEVAKKFLKFRAKKKAKEEPPTDKWGQKIKVKEEVEVSEQAEPPKTHPSAAAGASKMAMVSSLTNAMAAMSKSEMEDFFNKTMASIGDYGQKDNSEKNRSSVKAKSSPIGAKNSAIKEDIADMFEGEELTEEFKEKATTLFEAVVSARVAEIELELEEAYEQALEEEVQTLAEQLSEQVESHLNYVTEKWYEDNQVAIESQIRSDIMESFITGLKNLFLEHNIDIPQERIDVVETLSTRVEELEDELNETINENITLKSAMQEVEKETAMYEVSEGLSALQMEKFRKLAEGVEFKGDIDSYKKRLNVVKEFTFKNKDGNKKVVAEESQPDGVSVLEEEVNNTVKKYADAINKKQMF